MGCGGGERCRSRTNSGSLSFGALPNLKVTAVFYLFPILVLFVVRRGWKLAVIAVAIASSPFSPLPFLVPEVSLDGYLAILRAVGRHGLSTAFLIRNLQYAALFLLPIGMLAGFRKRTKLTRGQIYYLGAIAIGLLGACFSGAKIGAGSYHLLPLTLPILGLYFWIRSERNETTRDHAFAKLSIAWVLTMLLYSSNFVGRRLARVPIYGCGASGSSRYPAVGSSLSRKHVASRNRR